MKHLQLINTPIFEQLKIEEALLRADEENWCITNTGSCPAIVMGISGKEEDLLHAKEIKRQQLPVIRRYSGGGCVVVDQETIFVTLIGNSDLLEGPCFPEPIMRWAEELLSSAIPNLTLKESDFVLGEKKVAGNAQYIRKGRFCHHLTLLWDFSEERMGCLKMPKRAPKYRKERGHTEFLTKLKGHLPTKDTFLDALKGALERRFLCQVATLDEALAIAAKPHRKSTQIL